MCLYNVMLQILSILYHKLSLFKIRVPVSIFSHYRQCIFNFQFIYPSFFSREILEITQIFFITFYSNFSLLIGSIFVYLPDQ